MLLEEILEETRMVWARRGNKVVRKFRCTSGKRKGRVVAKPSQCFQAFDIKKRLTLRKTKAQKGPIIKRRTQRTKRINPASRRVQSLNKRR